MSEEPEIDLDAWEAQAPPADFAERVLARVRAESPVPVKPPARRRRWAVAGGVTGALALAAALALRIGSAPQHGEAIARERLEVSLGSRARAVLEPGAQVKWDGADVVQAHGDVFYRVEPGARFRVHTPAGDVEVEGTCFAVKIRGEGDAMNKRDAKSGVIGAALSALAFVGVYEGKVAVSHAGSRVDVGAGESAQAGSDGVHASGNLGDGEKAFDAKASAASGDTPLAQANDNLVAQVSEYRSRLEAIAAQKIELEQQLKRSEDKLAAADGGPGRTRAEYDLTQEDWAELAKKGQVKYRVPCLGSDGWDFPASKLQTLGLAPQDAAVLKDAYQRSHDRVWKEIRPLCVAALGATPDVIDKIGADQCPHLIYDAAVRADPEAAREAHTQAAEIRAGLRPEPGPNDKVNPVTRMFLILTGANGAFEQDLAKSFGPEEAHRLAQSDEMCNSNSRWGGGKKRGEGN
ncbi:MAG: hypothetical protein JWP97_1764 [Labilithrix sp.]|nr:hypothetical protein [Labilithrix sp.]